jgi:hypothetical protein
MWDKEKLHNSQVSLSTLSLWFSLLSLSFNFTSVSAQLSLFCNFTITPQLLSFIHYFIFIFFVTKYNTQSWRSYEITEAGALYLGIAKQLWNLWRSDGNAGNIRE